jgi:hypothetical protein
MLDKFRAKHSIPILQWKKKESEHVGMLCIKDLKIGEGICPPVIFERVHMPCLIDVWKKTRNTL